MAAPAGVRHVVIVGGGITGLAAAHRLADPSRADQVRVTLLEASERLGGKVETGRCGEWTVELGPDGFLAREPDALQLCEAVGLGSEMVRAETGRAGVWVGGRVRWLPPGLVLGVPVRLGPLRRSGAVGPVALLRAAAEPLVPRRAVGPDDPLGPILRRRLGSEIFERLIDPLLSGIYAGSAETMSLGAVAPRLLEALRARGSLRRGLRAGLAAEGGGGTGPMFLTVAGGLDRLVDRLAQAIPDGCVRRSCPATGIGRLPDGTWSVTTPGSALEPADAVIVAAPAPVAASLLAGANAAAARALAGIPYASVAPGTLAYPVAALPALPEASGFLVARRERRRMTACTFLGRKWPHLRADDVVLLRASVGRDGDESLLALPEAQLAAEVHIELRRALGVRAAPSAITVRRWPQALPQYRAGHLGRIEALDDALRSTPRLQVAGAALRGVGLPACIRDGRRAADVAIAAARDGG